MTVSGNFERFQYFNLKQIFWKTKTFFKKPEYGFLVESNKIEKASFSNKNSIPKANIKTNKMVRAKPTYHKEPVTTLA